MFTREQQVHREYNMKQTEVGSCLKTLKGSRIQRSKFGVGKVVGYYLYFHRSYMPEILNKEEIARITKAERKYKKFKYNCIRLDLNLRQIVLQECPGFDTDREPEVGYTIEIKPNGKVMEPKMNTKIFHHKYLWVKNDYTGFDVKEAWEWSKTWLSVLTETADGISTERWERQLQRFNLQ